jgi:signal transduction histidine kinase/DNA-binding NarL/FixJ family response regulator
MAEGREIEQVFSRQLAEWPGLWCRLRGPLIDDASAGLRALLGLTSIDGDPGVAIDLRARLHPDDRGRFTAGGPRVEARARDAEGRWRWLVWETVNAIGDVTLCFVRDASEERRAERRLRLQFAVARELAETARLSDALPRILRSVATAEGWRVGLCWVMNEEDRSLRLETSWADSESSARDFVADSRGRTFLRGQGVPGLVWQNDAPMWIENMASETLPRSAAASRAGLHCVCAYPLRRGPELFGVIELFTDEPRSPDADAMEAVDLVCVQLGLHLARSHAENALGRARSRLEYVVKNAPIVLFAADSDGRIVLHDGGVVSARRDGTSPMLGRSVLELFGTRSASAQLLGGCFARARGGESFTLIVDGGDGRRYETRWAPLLDDRGRSAGVIGVGLDITDLEEAKGQLKESERLRIDSERMASLGTLAAGVAHEINNPLTYVNILLGRLVSLEQANATDELGRHRLEMLDEVREGVGRVEQIVRALRMFSSGDEEAHGPVDVHEALEAALRMVGHEIRHRAELVRAYGDIPRVRGSSARLSQVFLHLLVNAAQSMPEGEAHTHQLRVATRKLDDGRVVVEIVDSGTGIPRELVGRIFEPFFTTRRVGQGSGLGLSICRGIVNAMGGEIAVESELGHGSRFSVVLPAYVADQPSAAAAASGFADGTHDPAAPQAPWRATPLPRRRARILVVDDDRAVARVVATVLGEHHEITTAASGREALGALERQPDVDLIVCDLMMPEVSGIDLYESLVLVRPELEHRFIFMTGGAFTPAARAFLERVTAPRIEKPFQPEALVDLVAEVLACAAEDDEDAAAPSERGEPRLREGGPGEPRRQRPRTVTRPPRRD